VNGEVLGAIGVAGLDKETDTDIANTAAAALSPDGKNPQHNRWYRCPRSVAPLFEPPAPARPLRSRETGALTIKQVTCDQNIKKST
jgi:hypothetical protein